MGNQVDAPGVGRKDLVIPDLADHIAAVQQEGCPDEAGHLAGTNTGGVVGVGCRYTAGLFTRA